ncbi:DNA topoisomerase IB [Luteimonas aquatica]|uniref:DNA topoisomerase IB n=1 Tax=Luteimonas aquatica TaxID=450364 RepID=UPI001F5ACD0A|nr:DNA topoisomerase IB [Luteimonas aquatica]
MPSQPRDRSADATGKRSARAAGLLYVNDQEPGIVRMRSGRGFVYRLPGGRRVAQPRTLERIRALAIPPAYRDVWICRTPRGHLQATGRDARGRKQYRYHADWRSVRDADKFARLVDFGNALPRLRRRLRADLRLPGLPADKVLAIAVSLLLETQIRIGSEAYERSNGSYGLTTLRNRHVSFLRAGRARLSFKGKGGRRHTLSVDDPRLVRLVRACQSLPGQQLFQYRDDGGRLRPVDSGAVNEYLLRVLGAPFTAKEFRTWAGTMKAFQCLAAMPLPKRLSDRALAKVRGEVTGEVAALLGNTPAVSRKSYIDPSLFPGWQDGSLARAAATARGARQWEQALVRFLKQARRRPRR